MIPLSRLQSGRKEEQEMWNFCGIQRRIVFVLWCVETRLWRYVPTIMVWLFLMPFYDISKLQPTRCNITWFIYFYSCSTCFRRFLRPSAGAQKLYIQLQVLSTNTAACCYHGWDGTISSTLAASSSIGWQYLKLYVQLLCSWWWAEELPETCRATVEINKSRNIASCWL